MAFRPEVRDRLPLPLARLYRRAYNAKSRLERHGHALYLCEALLKIAASVQIAAYVQSERRDAKLDALLKGLALPSLGHWVEFLERLGEHHSARADLPLPDVGAVAARLLEERSDLPATRSAIRTMARWVGRVEPLRGERVRVLDFLQRIPPYRNEVVGHGALRDENFYGELADELLEAATELYERSGVWTTGDLVYVAQATEAAGQGRTYESWNLMGPDAIRDEGLDATAVGGAPLAPGHVYLRKAKLHLDLHPLLVCHPAPPDAGVVFLNRSRSGTRIEHLDYVTGETVTSTELLTDHRAVLGRLLGKEVSEGGAAALAAACGGGDVQAEPDGDGSVQRFGDFDLVGRLGEGGMGVVYLARQRSLARLVALKMLPPSLVGDGVALARFQREVRALARADHPNVVRVFQHGKTDGTFWYTMELVEGGDLREVATAMRRSPDRRTLTDSDLHEAVSTASDRHQSALFHALPAVPQLVRPSPPTLGSGRPYYARVAELFRDAARGLQHLHERGVLHRDIKPGNVMVTRADGRAVLMDLGLALVAGEASVSDARGVLGTIPYTAPEQLVRSQLRVDHRADVYSLGASLYELVVGRPPYVAEDDAALVASVVRAPPPAPRRVDANVPPDLDAIVQKAMDRDPARRYASAADMAEDLDRYSLGSPVAARPPSLRRLAGLWYRRNQAAALVGAASVAALLVGGIWFMASMAAARGRAETAEREALGERDRARVAERESVAARDAEAASAAKARAEAERAEAAARRIEELSKDTRALSLIAASALEQDQDPMLSVMLARDALRLRPIPVAVSRAQAALAGCLERHVYQTDGGAVDCVVLSTDGLVAAGCRDGSLWFQSLRAPGAPPVHVRAHEGGIKALEFSPREDVLLSVGAEGTLRVWSVSDMDAEHPRVAPVMAVSSIGPLASGGFLASGLHVFAVPPRWRVLRSDSGSTVTLPNTDRTVRVWPMGGNRPAATALASPLTFASAAHGRDLLVAACEDGRASILDAQGRMRAAVQMTGPVVAGAFSRDDAYLLLATETEWALWRTGGDLVWRAPLPRGIGTVEWVGFREGSTGAFVLGSAGRYVSGAEQDGGGAAQVSAVLTMRHGIELRSSTSGSVLRALDSRAWDPWLRLDGHRGRVATGDLDAPSGWVATGATDGTVRVWKAYGAPGPAFPEGLVIDPVVDFDVFPTDHRIAALRNGGTAEVWDESGNRLCVLERPSTSDPITSLRIAGGGRFLAGTGPSGRAYLWSDGGRLLARMSPPQGQTYRAAVSSPNGKHVIIVGTSAIHALNRDTSRVASMPLDGDVTSTPVVREDGSLVAFSVAWPRRQDPSLLTPYERVQVMLWRPLDGRSTALSGHRREVTKLLLDGNEARLVSKSSDAVRVWGLDGGELGSFVSTDETIVSAYATEGLVRVVTVSTDLSRGYIRELRGDSAFTFDPDDRLISAALAGAEHGGCSRPGTGVRDFFGLGGLGREADISVSRDGGSILLRLSYGVSVVDPMGHEIVTLAANACGASSGTAVSFDGRSVVDLTQGRLRVFSTDPQEVLAAAAERIDRTYTDLERTKYLGIVGDAPTPNTEEGAATSTENAAGSER